MLVASHAELSDLGYQQLWAFHQLLRQRNEDGDLTRIHAFESMVTLHYVDCIWVAKKLGAKLPSPLLDIGSGAGFPSIPLKIAAPHLHIISSEGRAKRVAFQDEAIATCGLQGLETFCGKTFSTFDRPVQGVITRALELVPVTLARVRAFVPPGGLAIFMKGPNCDAEIADAVRAFPSAWQLEDDLAYQLPFSTHQRRLVTFRRLHDPTELVRRRSRTIDSPDNDSFKAFKALLTPRGVRAQGAVLVAGSKLVAEALRDFPQRCLELLVPRGTETLPPEAAEALSVTVLKPELFRDLDVSGTRSPLLKIAVEEPLPWDGSLQGCTLAVPFQDPENVGAVLRSAVAFGVQRVVLLRDSASPWHPKALRAGGTAALRLTLLRGPDLVDLGHAIAGKMFQTEADSAEAALPASMPMAQAIVTLSAEGTPLQTADLPEDFLLVPGAEGSGLPADLRARSLAIAMAEGCESLNAATATAIVLHQWYLRWRVESSEDSPNSSDHFATGPQAEGETAP